MTRILLFAGGTAVIGYLSRQPLRAPRSHGFPRFFAWECMLALLLLNFVSFSRWFADPWSPRQLASWVLLFGSIALAVPGGLLLLRRGRPSAARAHDPALFAFERTTRLVTTGVYRYVRHPLYGSLLVLTWGIFFKRVSWWALALAVAASVLLTLTAKREERENLAYFGEEYRAYRRVSRMFVPLLF